MMSGALHVRCNIHRRVSYIFKKSKLLHFLGFRAIFSSGAKPSAQLSIIYYIADLPVTPLRVHTNKSDNIAVPYASLRSFILLLSSLSFAFFFHHIKTIVEISMNVRKRVYKNPHLRKRKNAPLW